MKLRFRPAAENDLIEIGDYIACDNPRAAAEFIATIREKCTALVETPNIGGKRPELSAGLRSIPVGHYVIFYRVLADAVEIVNVIHGARDIDSLF